MSKVRAALDLDECICIGITREEAAVICIALSGAQIHPPLTPIADRLIDRLQREASPVGVIVRVLHRYDAPPADQATP